MLGNYDRQVDLVVALNYNGTALIHALRLGKPILFFWNNTLEKALGEAKYSVGEQEANSRVFRRSLFVVKDMKAGEVFTEENVRSIRPGNGLHPRYLEDVLGRRAAQGIEHGTPLRWELIV